MNKNEINIPNIKKMLCDRLKTSGWMLLLEPIINSDQFDEILYFLKTEVKNDKRFTPKIKGIFKAFEECPYNNLKTIFISQDPYPELGVADGIAFSCSKTKTIQPPLRYIFKELNESQWDSLDPNLKRWSNQGVLLLNTALTVQIGKIGSHHDLWKPIIKLILSGINDDFNEMPVVLFGVKAEEWHLRLHNQKIFKIPHPASAAYNGGKWDCDNIFYKINMILQDQNRSLILW
jgi:uracil-DNA glycosylase